MNTINILSPVRYPGKIHAVSSSFETNEAKNVLNNDESFWCTAKSHNAVSEYIIIDYGSIVAVNIVEIFPSPSGKTTFPSEFRLECSIDGINWEVIKTENRFTLDEDAYRLALPITVFQYLKLYIVKPKRIAAKYFAEIGKIQAGIQGAVSITASSTSSYEHDPFNVMEVDNQKYWESEITSSASRQWIEVDCGMIFPLTNIGIVAPQNPALFPEQFSIEITEDKKIWTTLADIKRFKAQPGGSYIFGGYQFNARYIRLNVVTVQTEKQKYCAQIAGIFAHAALPALRHFHVNAAVQYATVFQPGIVKLAADGDTTPGAVVQANDTRLRDASTIFKGIVQLASDGSNEEGLAVQASDSRLAPATELKPGIVRLAYDREVAEGAVVQSTDSRIKEATDTTFGIVKLCPNGQYINNAVVRGDDSRLQKATTKEHGIVRLAENGEDNEFCVVQGNDRRLKDATIVSKGIVELAEDGEDAPGVVVQGNDRRLKEATTHSKGIVELAEDGEDAPGVVVQGNDRRLKEATTHSKGIVELAEDGEDAPNVVVQGNDRRLKEATTKSKGIVELAEDGEDAAGVVVQGNDRRLKEATTHNKGIVELAEDGEDAPGVVVQGNDKRLKEATTHNKGIVELAEDGEDAAGVVVQGNDRRLKEATTKSKGIVELAEDGEDAAGVVVQGNDRRLKEATTKSKGIVELAEDGEDAAGVVVQGNDRRLKEATTHSKGIVELAEDGEDAPGVVVQGNDRRLKEATTHSKGIVELAEDGEDAPGVVVQGNDRRLKDATEETPGIVTLAKHGETRKNHVVQSDDPRLSDKRDPLPHTHDYAPIVHSFDSHTGTIAITQEKTGQFNDITPPTSDSAVLYGKNIANTGNTIGVAGIAQPSTDSEVKSYGVLGHAPLCGVRGQSQGNTGKMQGCGVLGISRFGAGGVFASEHNWSLVADGFGAIAHYDDTVHLTGQGKALFVNGESCFKGKIVLDTHTQEYHANIVEMFETDEQEFISPGDVLVVSTQGNAVLSRSRTAYNKGVIGVVAGNPVVVINNAAAQTKLYPVVLTGSVLCKVDARQKPVKPGDLLVTSDTPGCSMAATIDSFDKVGTVFAKALTALDEGIALIPVMIWKM
jgi:hypothetical protein